MIELKHDDRPTHRAIFLGGSSRRPHDARRGALSILKRITEAAWAFIVQLFR